jgi:hypothetical protein
MFLKKIQNLFLKEDIPFAVVGGYAVAIHGVARGTFDLDIITQLDEENLLRIESALQSINYKSTIPISAKELANNLEHYKMVKHLVAWNFVNLARQRESLDILITEDIRDCAIFQAQTDFGKLPVISIEDLIRIKSKTQRSQDLEDVIALRKIQEKQGNSEK